MSTIHRHSMVAMGATIAGLALLARTSAPLFAQTPTAAHGMEGMQDTGDTHGTHEMQAMMHDCQDMMEHMEHMMAMMQMSQMMPMTPGMATTGLVVPPVKGFAEGHEIRFIHTEASDPQVAQMLTDMMGSPVLVVASLAQVPAALANVYVFTNGLRGDGPFGFQPDVFDNPPGTESYHPLRAVNLATWRDGSSARELTSAAETKAAEATGELTIERSGAVVNMPFLTWPGGHR